MIPNLNNLSPYDTLGVQERVDRFCKRSIKKSSKVEGLKLALSMIDLTTLEGKDTPGKSKATLLQGHSPTRSVEGASQSSRGLCLSDLRQPGQERTRRVRCCCRFGGYGIPERTVQFENQIVRHAICRGRRGRRDRHGHFTG